VRGLAIEQGLRRGGYRGEYRMFGPSSPFPDLTPSFHEAVELSESELLDPVKARESPLALALGRYRPDLLVVDLFWLTVRHLLPLPGCECWLILRSCPPTWMEGPAGLPFVPDLFRRVIAIEPMDAAHVTDRIDPVVIRNPDECRPRHALRERLGVATDRQLIVLVYSGGKEERPHVESPHPSAVVYTFDLREPGGLFPIAEWLNGADVVVSGAGYNSFWEAHWLGYAPRTTFIPFRATIDNQLWRITACSGHAPRENGADTLARWIAGATKLW
jgi:hypothetical protein